MRMNPAFRCDTRPWKPGNDTEAVTAEEAYRAMTNGEGSEAESARLRMLARMGLSEGEGRSAAEAREMMIQRGKRSGR